MPTRTTETPGRVLGQFSVVAGAVVTALAMAVPPLRPVMVVTASVLAVVAVLVGIRVFRPSSSSWWLIALMLALWGVASVLLQVQGFRGPLVAPLVYAGQGAAVGVVVRVAHLGSGSRAAARVSGHWVDVVIIATVLGLVGAQLAVAGVASSASLGTLAVQLVDVAIIATLLGFVVGHGRLRSSSYLALGGAVVTTAYDLWSSRNGSRLALPGDPAQVAGIASVLLFGVSALQPSMVHTFDPSTYASRRRASGALLGLLPLVVAPMALWALASWLGSPGLPTWSLLLGGAVVAGLCLVRAARVLNASEYLAEHDPLTDLANRRGLARAFGQPPPSAGRTMLLIDIDQFKAVNDTYGHDVGDALLQSVRDRLLEAAHEAGVVARLGGDEFIVLVASDQADAAAELILHRLREPIPVGDLRLRISASIGSAAAGPETSLADLLTAADVAMYAAKEAGRDQVVGFEPAMRVEIARRFTLTREVRNLLEERAPDVGQLQIHYQPIVELVSGNIVGAEALVRWSHPRHGLLVPADFLELVSGIGLDARLDAIVLDAVINQLSQWHVRGLAALPVSVNLTADSLADPHLARRVLTALAETGVPTTLLRVEILEHEELPQDSPAGRSLHELAAAGVTTHLDDYGVGYTSLDYLHRFPVKVLKLDRSVITAMGSGDALTVRGVAAMAAVWGVDILAEGVETPQQRQQLIGAGVRYGQGYLFSKPLPESQYQPLLAPSPRHPHSVSTRQLPHNPCGSAPPGTGMLPPLQSP